MKRLSRLSRFAPLLISAAIASGLNSANAATAPGTTPGYEAADPRLLRYERMGKVMGELQERLAVMSKRMADPNLPEAERKTMVVDMTQMASMMRRMSGLADRPTMNNDEARQELDKMGKEIAAMRKRHESVVAK